MTFGKVPSEEGMTI